MVWLPVEELHILDWAETAWPVIKEYQEQLISLMPALEPKKRKAGFHREKDR